MKIIVLVLASLIVFAGCKSEPEKAADTIYFGGDIITMEGNSPQYVEAVTVKDGKILFVGSKAEAMKFEGTETELVDLKGKTMFPGFIDGHCHFGGFGAQAITANLLATPDGSVNDMDALINALKKWAKGPDLQRLGWVLGMGYDDAVLKEGRHPTKEDLDKVSTEIPVVVIHISGHFAVMNSVGLKAVGITAKTKKS